MHSRSGNRKIEHGLGRHEAVETDDSIDVSSTARLKRNDIQLGSVEEAFCGGGCRRPQEHVLGRRVGVTTGCLGLPCDMYCSLQQVE